MHLGARRAFSAIMKPLIAVGQMTSSGDRAHNLQVAGSLIQQAKERGAAMLFLPECFSFIGSKWQETVATGEPLTGPCISHMQTMAREHQLWLSLGGFNEKPLSGPEDGTGAGQEKVYNSHLIIDNKGGIRAVYRKIHLFDVEVPNGPVLLESRYTEAGSEVVVVPDSPVGRLGLSTCYDVRFPEMYARLVEQGAQVLLVPSAFTVPTGTAHWEVLLRARAIESQCYVVAAAQAGRHNEKRESHGHAMVVDPWGKVLADAADASPSLITAEIDLGLIDDIRAKMPVRKHRRCDLFGGSAGAKY